MPPSTPKFQFIFWGLCLLLFASMLISLAAGAAEISIRSILAGNLNEGEEAIIYSIRMPRILLAAFVGAALSLSGAAMQGLFRNPLAEPGLIGVASGAALAVGIVIVLGAGGHATAQLYTLSFAAFLGGAGTCFLIFYFAKLSGSFSVTYMLLAGIAFNAIAAAGTGFLMFLSTDEQLRTLTFWTMGNLGAALWPSALVAASVLVPASILLMRKGRELNILLLGEQEAKYLGVNSAKLKYLIITCTALLVGVSVAVSGIIGFVGLVVPHLIRLTIGPDHRILLPLSAVGGALLLVIADTIARTAVAPSEMPVGILTSLIGGPFFLWLLVRQYGGRFGL